MPLLTFLRSAILTSGCMYGGGRWQHEVSRAAAVPHEKRFVSILAHLLLDVHLM